MTPEETPNTERERERERERVTSFSLLKCFRRFLTNKKWIRQAHHDKTVIVSLSNYLHDSFIKNKIISVLQGLSSGFKFGLGMLAAFITAGLLAVAVTGVLNSFQDGDTLTAGKLNTNFNTLKTAIASIETIPAGTIVAYSGTTPPTGWLLCDGAQVSQTTYANLYTVIGCNFGCSGGNFNLPDLRGRFLRGRDGGSGRDPDSGARTAMNTGGNTADNVGSVQGDDFKSHTHLQWSIPAGSASGPSGGLGNSGIQIPTTATGGNETRPVNAYVNFIVKQ